MTLDKSLHSKERRWCGTQRRIGITGGIASGKSSVAQFLSKEKGLPILDADNYSRELLAKDTICSKTVIKKFGNSILQSNDNKILNRKALGNIIFSNKIERIWLEQLLHPLVKQKLQDDLVSMHDSPILILMIPLLFEANLTGLCSEIWLIDCNEDQQLKRLMKRDNLNNHEAKIRIKSQIPLHKKHIFADLIINNKGKRQSWKKQVEYQLSYDPLSC